MEIVMWKVEVHVSEGKAESACGSLSDGKRQQNGKAQIHLHGPCALVDRPFTELAFSYPSRAFHEKRFSVNVFEAESFAA